MGIVIAGGSLAGLRAAETLRHHGYDGAMTIVSDEPHMPYDRPPLSKHVLAALAVPLQRVLGDEIGAVCAGVHRDQGVDLRLSASVDHFTDDGHGRVTGVVLDDGVTIAADVVVVGIGVMPNTEWLHDSG